MPAIRLNYACETRSLLNRHSKLTDSWAASWPKKALQRAHFGGQWAALVANGSTSRQRHQASRHRACWPPSARWSFWGRWQRKLTVARAQETGRRRWWRCAVAVENPVHQHAHSSLIWNFGEKAFQYSRWRRGNRLHMQSSQAKLYHGQWRPHR